MADPYAGVCVTCSRPAVALCVIDGDNRGGTLADWCADCIANGEDIDNFGRCYICRDYGDHAHCIGVPCQCPCPSPDALARQAEIDAVLAKLTPAERQVLGF